MSNKIIEPKIETPTIEVDKKLLEGIKQQTNTEQQVIVHCYFHPSSFFTRYRVWRSTYLKDLHSSHRSQLLNAYNISFYPIWTPVIGMGKVSFTLVFEGLPKDCTTFDLDRKST